MRRAGIAVGATRATIGAVVIAILLHTFLTTPGGQNLFDYFGYFTNLTSMLTAVTMILTGGYGIADRIAPRWLGVVRAVATTCMIVVAVIYNVLVPGAGSAPAWVSISLHLVFPLLVFGDWALVGDRPRLRWSLLWAVLPYPLVWLAVVLWRGVTDGWVPYGFLLPERGAAPLILHIVGLLATLGMAGALVWATSRAPVRGRRSTADRELRRAGRG